MFLMANAKFRNSYAIAFIQHVCIWQKYQHLCFLWTQEVAWISLAKIHEKERVRTYEWELVWPGMLNFRGHSKGGLISESWDLFMSFVTIIWDIILGWYYNILEWKYIMILNWEKKLFWTSKKFVYLIFIPKYRNIIPK